MPYQMTSQTTRDATVVWLFSASLCILVCLINPCGTCGDEVLVAAKPITTTILSNNAPLSTARICNIPYSVREDDERRQNE